MVLSSVISVLFLPCFRILYGTLSILMVRLLEPMVTSRLDITEKLSILTLTITSNNTSNTSSSNNSNSNITAMTITLTSLTPRSISTTGTGPTSTLTTVTDTRCQANQDRDSSRTVSFLNILLQFISDNLFHFQTRRTETCPVFLIPTLVMIFLMNCNDSSLSTELPTQASLCRVTTTKRAILLPTGGSSERSSCNGGILSRTSSNCDLSRVHPSL